LIARARRDPSAKPHPDVCSSSYPPPSRLRGNGTHQFFPIGKVDHFRHALPDGRHCSKHPTATFRLRVSLARIPDRGPEGPRRHARAKGCFPSRWVIIFAGMWLIPLLCVFATSAASQQRSPQPDAKELLLEVRKKLNLTITRLPKYMCTETIDRSTFQTEAKITRRSCDDLASRRKKTGWKVRKCSSGRLRLDLATSGGSEMYSWAGETRFQDPQPGRLDSGGSHFDGRICGFP